MPTPSLSYLSKCISTMRIYRTVFNIVLILLPSSLLAQQSGWQVVDSIYTLVYHHIDCADSLHCMAYAGEGFGAASLVRRTTDGGNTWETVHRDIRAAGFQDVLRYNSIAHPTPDICMIACDSGIVLRTTDGGETWRRIRPGTASNLFRLSMADGNTGIMMSYQRTIWRTTDAGETWDSLVVPDEGKDAAIQDLQSLPPRRIVAVLYSFGRDSATMRSDDNGRTWQRFPYPPHGSVISFVDDETGWTCGAGATGRGYEARDVIAHTSDGGESWTVQLDSLVDPPFGLSNIDFADRTNGIAVGPGGGKMVRTTDGGVSWRYEDYGLGGQANSSLESVSYPSSNRAFAVTSFGVVIRYSGQPTSASINRILPEHHPLLFPNPLWNNRRAELLFSLPRRSSLRLSVVNALGDIVYRTEPLVYEAGNHRIQLNLDGVSQGAYLLRIMTEDAVSGLSLVVQ